MDETLTVSSQELVFPWWVVLLQGLALVFVGGLLMFETGVTTIVLVTFIGWWWLISGIFELASLIMDRTMWGWRLFSGILGIFAGGYIIGAPLVGSVVVVGFATIMLGINGMIIGVVDVAKAFQGAGWGKGLIGVLSFIFGWIIAFNWTSFITTLPWVWGLFALISGLVAIFGAFTIKKLQAA